MSAPLQRTALSPDVNLASEVQIGQVEQQQRRGLCVVQAALFFGGAPQRQKVSPDEPEC